MKLVVIDGQGGRLGCLLVEGLRKRLPQAQICALGTNAVATAAMLKAGADVGATGENPVIRNVMDADGVLGPVGIVVANAILGEVTPAMAEAVGSCQGKKYLVAGEQLRRSGGRRGGAAPARLCGAGGRGAGGGAGPVKIRGESSQGD